jgi:hypothetical protein
MPCAPNQCLVGCIMNDPSRMPARDRVADKGGECQEQQRACSPLRAADLPIIFTPQWRISFRQITIRNRVAVHEERG